MTERRFTDSDVALILARAAELDARSGGESLSRGLSEGELREIAAEVGIDPDMVGRAVVELGRPALLRRFAPLGPGTVHRAMRAIPGRLHQADIASLVRLVDERIPVQGTIGEAVGSVRWSGGTRRLRRQVSFEPSADETLIRVEERFGDHIRAILHVLPAVYGGALGMGIGVEALGAGAPAVALAGGVATGAFLLGRGVWNWLAGRSRRRVAALADELADEAARISRPEE